jgi:hypothetical protein
MKIRVINSSNELVAIDKIWNAIISANPETNAPFYSWEWFYYSWVHLNDGETPYVILAEERGEIIGILPLVLSTKSRYGISYNELSFCNTANTPRNTIFVSNIKHEQRVTENIFAHLLLKTSDWDIINLVNISNRTTLHDYLLKSKLNYAMIQTLGRQSPRVVIGEEESIDTYFNKHVSKKTRKRYRVNLDRLKTCHLNWEIRFYTAENEMREGLSSVISVRENSWKEKFEANRYQLFISEVSQKLSLSGEILISVLYIGNQPAAAIHVLRKNKDYYAITNDYNMKYREYAPGACLLYYVLQKAFSESWNFFDITGEAHDYKISVCNELISHSSFQLFHDKIKSRSIYFSKTKLLPRIRKLMRIRIVNDVINLREYPQDLSSI